MTSKRTSAVAVVNSSFFSLRVIISSDLKQNFLLALSTALPLYFPAVNLSWTCSDQCFRQVKKNKKLNKLLPAAVA